MKQIGICDVGKVREINQDTILAVSREGSGLFVVADGMGGHSRGEKASQHIVSKLREWWERFSPEKYDYDFKRMILALKQIAEEANREIYHTYNNDDICGSTMVLLFICRNAYGILHAGDSRAYLYHAGRFRQMTIDDVWENRPDLTPRERKLNWEYCHGKLLNAVGIREEMQCKVITDELQEGMVFLLCSDGLYKYCPERFLKRYMKKARKAENVEYSVACLLEEVYAGPAKDNISIILVQI